MDIRTINSCEELLDYIGYTYLVCEAYNSWDIFYIIFKDTACKMGGIGGVFSDTNFFKLPGYPALYLGVSGLSYPERDITLSVFRDTEGYFNIEYDDTFGIIIPRSAADELMETLTSNTIK